MTAGPCLRAAGAFDAPVLAALHAACFPDEPWDTQALRRLMAMPGAFAVLALEGTEVDAPTPLGFVLGRRAADEAEILSLGVLPGARRRGVGSSLVAAGCEAAAAAGARRLHLEVAADNEPARRLYARAGFAEAGRRPGYYERADGSSVDAVLLARDLTG